MVVINDLPLCADESDKGRSCCRLWELLKTIREGREKKAENEERKGAESCRGQTGSRK